MNYINTAYLKLTTAILAGLSTYGALAQTSTLPVKGWAKNSVNAVVFRKNSLVTYQTYQYTAFYNGDGFVVLGKRKIGTTTWETKVTPYKGNVADAHNSISIIIDGAGYLHMSWDHHSSRLNYCKSDAPGSLNMAARTAMIGTQEAIVSYPEFHLLLNGDLLFMYREGSSGSGNMVVNQYSISQRKWLRIHNNLISGQNLRNAYWQSHVDSKGTVHVSWVWRESSNVASNHDLCYARSFDNGKTWKKSNGANYIVPITAATAEYAVRIPQNSELINQTSMYGDDMGRPYICSYWRPSGTNVPQYHIVYHDGIKWVTIQASNRRTAFSLSGAGTQKIPISRPQILVNTVRGVNQAYIIYRDVEQGDRVSLLYSVNIAANRWVNQNLTTYTTGSWEPTYDSELWRTNKMLHIFVQRVGQGNGETLEELAPQNVTVLQWDPAQLVTSLDEQSVSASNITCFPNPFHSELTVNAPGEIEYLVYDLTGNLILTGSGYNTINIGEQLKPGMFVVKVRNQNINKIFKVYKKSF